MIHAASMAWHTTFFYINIYLLPLNGTISGINLLVTCIISIWKQKFSNYLYIHGCQTVHWVLVEYCFCVICYTCVIVKKNFMELKSFTSWSSGPPYTFNTTWKHIIGDSDGHDKDFDDFNHMVMLVMLAMMVGAGTFGCMMMLILHVICIIYVSYDYV